MSNNKNRNPSLTAKSVAVKKPESFFTEQPPQKSERAPACLHRLTRRDVLLFSAGAVAALSGAGFLLPQNTLSRLGVRGTINAPGKEWFLNHALRIDDDVAEALYSEKRMVPTYTKSQITNLRNNYNGATPDPGYISGWNLTLDGLASGLTISLDIRNLMTRFSIHDQITRLVCVEGWSAIAWWAGRRFYDLLRAYPPISQANRIPAPRRSPAPEPLADSRSLCRKDTVPRWQPVCQQREPAGNESSAARSRETRGSHSPSASTGLRLPHLHVLSGVVASKNQE